MPMSRFISGCRRQAHRCADPYGRAWHAGMAAGQIRRAVGVVLAGRADRRTAGDLSLHRQQSRRGGARQTPASALSRIGHLPPPLSPAALPPGLHAIERLLDEYSVADGLDPARRERLIAAIREEARDRRPRSRQRPYRHERAAEAIVRLDSFVCDVKDTLVADGLHVFGRGACGESASGRRAARRRSAGKHVAPGPAGSPWRGRRDVLPTGRNLFTVDTRAVPSRNASARHQARRGAAEPSSAGPRRLSERVMVDLWGSATMRTAGEEFAMALHLMGVAPVWDTPPTGSPALT